MMAAIFFGHAVASFSIRQLGDISRDAPRLVARKKLGLNVRFTPKADIGTQVREVRFVRSAQPRG